MKRRIAGLVCAVLLWPMFAFAQATGTGTVTGRVVDSSGAVLPGVTVTMKSPQALGQFTAVTDAQGLYRIANLPPAAARHARNCDAFIIVQPVTVRVATTLPVDFTLAVGAMSETVNVTAETPIVDPNGRYRSTLQPGLTQVPISMRGAIRMCGTGAGVFVRPDQATSIPASTRAAPPRTAPSWTAWT